MKKKVIIIISALVILVFALVLFLKILPGEKAKNNNQLVTATVGRNDIVLKVTESGTVEPLTTVDIKSEFSGEVKAIYVEEGDSVKAGDRLVLIQQESSMAKQIAQSRASYEQAMLNREEAERNLKRKEELYEKGFIALKEVEDAQKSFENSKISHELSEKQLWLTLGGNSINMAQALSEMRFDNFIIKSPMSGVVLDCSIEEGEMITSGTQSVGGGGTVLMVIADLSKLIVKTNINEVDVGQVKTGQPVDIGFDAIRGKIYRGRVKKIAPAGIQSNNIVVYPVEVEIIGSASGQLQREDDRQSQRKGMENILAQLNEKQQKEIRNTMQKLSQQGLDRDQMRMAIDEKLKEFGLGRPELAVGTIPGSPPIPPEIVEDNGIELIKPGMTGDLDIIIAQTRNTLVVPIEAVYEEDQQFKVKIPEGDKIEVVVVETGLEGEVNIEILSGLKEGQKVLLSPSKVETSESNKGDFGRPPM
ncbi:efflux RND transporter periplasmic adaptor subunit [bacterium]|nr:efflux RND transporter periplasmic adaptor subunit [bacterium]